MASPARLRGDAAAFLLRNWLELQGGEVPFEFVEEGFCRKYPLMAKRVSSEAFFAQHEALFHVLDVEGERLLILGKAKAAGASTDAAKEEEIPPATQSARDALRDFLRLQPLNSLPTSSLNYFYQLYPTIKFPGGIAKFAQANSDLFQLSYRNQIPYAVSLTRPRSRVGNDTRAGGVQTGSIRNALRAFIEQQPNRMLFAGMLRLFYSQHPEMRFERGLKRFVQDNADIFEFRDNAVWLISKSDYEEYQNTDTSASAKDPELRQILMNFLEKEPNYTMWFSDLSRFRERHPDVILSGKLGKLVKRNPHIFKLTATSISLLPGYAETSVNKVEMAKAEQGDQGHPYDDTETRQIVIDLLKGGPNQMPQLSDLYRFYKHFQDRNARDKLGKLMKSNPDIVELIRDVKDMLPRIMETPQSTRSEAPQSLPSKATSDAEIRQILIEFLWRQPNRTLPLSQFARFYQQYPGINLSGKLTKFVERNSDAFRLTQSSIILTLENPGNDVNPAAEQTLSRPVYVKVPSKL